MALSELDNWTPTEKAEINDLALFGDSPLFETPRSTANLVRPSFDRFLDYSRIFHEEHRYTNAGPLNRELERRLALFHDVEHCVTFANGFWALVLAIRALAIPERREVVVPALTYRRMADIIVWAGLTPRYCDVERETLALSTATAARSMSAETALLLAAHPLVNCCPAGELEELARARDVPLLVDAVESCYESIDGRRVGTFGEAEVFSLGATKLLNGFEGGYLTTNDGDLAERLLYMRGFGFNGHDNVEQFGINAKLNEVHAAMALASLDDVDEQVERNRTRYLAYQASLRAVPELRLVAFDESQRCGYKNIVVELSEEWPISREQTLELLHAENVLARAYYSPALHHTGSTGSTPIDHLPVTDACEPTFLVLPSGAQVSCEDILLIGELLEVLRDTAGSLSQLVSR